MTAAATPQQQLPYIETASGNRVSRTSVLFAPQRIAFDGKTTIHAGVQLRGDLARISIGQWSHVDANALLRPCHKVGADGKPTHFPLNIGSFTSIGANSVVAAAIVGSHVKIGKNVQIGERCILKDCCEIADGTILADDTVVPPLVVMGGTPGQIVSYLNESFAFQREREARALYASFVNN